MGIAAVMLRWRPSDFWRATPSEFWAAIEVLEEKARRETASAQ